jgi:hypothetical protein
MLRLSLLASMLCTSVIMHAYLIHTITLQDATGKKATLFGDLHHVDECMDFAFAQQQTKRISQKVVKAKKKKGTRVWYEGRNKGETTCKVGFRDIFLKKDLLPALDTVNKQKKLGMHNIENRHFLVDATLLGAKIRAGDQVETHIRTIQQQLRSIKSRGYYHPQDQLAHLTARLEHLQFIKSLPAQATMIERIIKGIKEEVLRLESMIKNAFAQGTLSKKQQSVLCNYMKVSQTVCKRAISRLVHCKEGKRRFTGDTIEYLIMATSYLFDVHFFLQYASSNETRQHVLIAGCAHTYDIAQLFKRMGYRVTYEAGISHKDLEAIPATAWTGIPAAIDEKDFDLIIK